MTRQEWNVCSAMVIALWPGQPWSKATIDVGWHVCSGLSAEAVKAAIVAMAKEGREWAPPPSAVYVRAEDMEKQARLGLPDPERLRDAEPQDFERGREWMKVIQGALADSPKGMEKAGNVLKRLLVEKKS